MKIDLQTLILITGIMHFVQVLVFYQQYRTNKTIAGPGWWLIWSLLEVLAFTAMLLRGNINLLPFIILVQSPLNLAGTFFVYFGIRRFLGRGLNLRVMVPLFLVYCTAHFYFAVFSDNIGMRSLFLDILLALVSFMAAWNLLKPKTRLVPAARFNAVFLILNGLVFIGRSADIILRGYEFASSPQSFFYLAQYFDALLIGIIWMVGFVIMMNQKLQAENLETKDRFQLIFETGPDVVVISRLDTGAMVECNHMFNKTFGYSRDEVIGKTTTDVNFWHDTSDRTEMIRLMSMQGYVENFETKFRTRDNRIFVGLLSAKIIELDGVRHIMSITRDIGDRKRAEEEIRLKNEELVKINAERDRFYSIIAHDLRSPFNSFLGLTRLMVEELPTLTREEIQKIAESLKKSAVNLYSLLENLLSWSTVKQGVMPFNRRQVDLDTTVGGVTELLQEQAGIKSIRIMASMAAGLGVHADPDMLRTVLRNLLTNSIKFTPPGGEIQLTALELPDGWIEICIRDNGIGMSQESLDNLFNPERQVVRKGTEGEPGTGFGLVLCHEFISMHGGRIWADSEPGKGSAVFFALPPK